MPETNEPTDLYVVVVERRHRMLIGLDKGLWEDWATLSSMLLTYSREEAEREVRFAAERNAELVVRTTHEVEMRASLGRVVKVIDTDA